MDFDKIDNNKLKSYFAYTNLFQTNSIDYKSCRPNKTHCICTVLTYILYHLLVRVSDILFSGPVLFLHKVEKKAFPLPHLYFSKDVYLMHSFLFNENKAGSSDR